jgi:predicted SAM-dependent methyltransferase
MSSVGQWVARLAQTWLHNFRLRHGLGDATPQPLSINTLPSANVEDERVLLHVGCGHANIDNIPLPGFRTLVWKEVRLDADESVHPDIVGTMADMAAVTDGFADAIYSSHGVEHLYWHDVPRCLAEFHRTLKEDGFVVITCPDVQAAAQMIAEDRMFETAYQSAAGPITPFDILYSYRPFVAANPEWMSHHCGFTLTTLMAVLREADFAVVHGLRRPGGFDLWVLGSKSQRTADEMAALVKDYLLPIS